MDELHRAAVATPSDRKIVITRAFHAPRRVVFDAWTKPEHVAQWWDPSRAPLTVCEIDLRPNGAFRFVNQEPAGLGIRLRGGTAKSQRPNGSCSRRAMPRLVLNQSGTLIFTEHDGVTTLTMTIACQSKADRDALLKMRVDVGTARTLDNLEEYLGQLGEAAKA